MGGFAAPVLREILLTASHPHPSLTPALGFTRSPFGLVLPLGVPLSVLLPSLHRSTTPPVGALVTLCHHAVTALALCHALSVLHRDVKTDNFILVDGTLCLTDWGSARRKPAPPDSGTLAALSLPLSPGVGTHRFAAPEILLSLPHTEAADAWSLGVTMASVCSGSLLFAGVGAIPIFAEHLTVLGSPALSESRWPALLSLAPAVADLAMGGTSLNRLDERLATLSPVLANNPALRSLVHATVTWNPDYRSAPSALLRLPIWSKWHWSTQQLASLAAGAASDRGTKRQHSG
jgi:serine/threonine protein kinase